MSSRRNVLWTIWYDDGKDDYWGARPVKSINKECNLYDGLGPHIFLFEGEASLAALDLRRRHPGKRFCVKEHCLAP